ncbi:hypothetical protein, partial [Heyndrickxia sporothermodurans]
MTGFKFITDRGPLPITRAVQRSLSYVQITGLAAATGLGTIPVGTRFVRITVSGAAVRYRADGTDPTPASGMPIAAGTTFDFLGEPSAIHFVGQAAGAVLD